MGIDPDGAAFLAAAALAGVDFRKTLTLGRQGMFASADELHRALDAVGVALRRDAIAGSARPAQRYADQFLRLLGAEEVAALDASQYEGADLLHDLNEPVPPEWHEQHTLVIDGGTSEHVFDFATALHNAMNMVAAGGHIISIVPANQQLGHGLYQLSPELYFRALGRSHGFLVLCCMLKESGIRSRWLRVADPAEQGFRLQGSTLGSTDLYVLAKRVGNAAFGERVLQSDYESAWEEGRAPRVGTAASRGSLKTRAFRALGPRGRERAAGINALVRAWRGNGMESIKLSELAEQFRSHCSAAE